MMAQKIRRERHPANIDDLFLHFSRDIAFAEEHRSFPDGMDILLWIGVAEIHGLGTHNSFDLVIALRIHIIHSRSGFIMGMTGVCEQLLAGQILLHDGTGKCS